MENLESNSSLRAPTSLREQVEEILASRVIAGEYEPGRMLTAPTLAVEFGVSATPVREALLSLERRGFLSPVRNKGFHVTEVTDEELRHLASVRVMLECPPVRDLAGTLAPEAVAELRGYADAIVESAREGRLKDYLAADTAFHMTLIDLVGNPHLSQIVRDLRGRTRLSGLVGIAESVELQETAAEHHEILELLEAGDGEGAMRVLERHIGHVVGIWSGASEHAID